MAFIGVNFFILIGPKKDKVGTLGYYIQKVSVLWTFCLPLLELLNKKGCKNMSKSLGRGKEQ